MRTKFVFPAIWRIVNGKPDGFPLMGLALLAASVLSVYSCGKHELPAPEEGPIELVDGLKVTGSRLSFDGPREFEEAMVQLQENPNAFAQKLSMAGFRNANHYADNIVRKSPLVYKVASASPNPSEDEEYDDTFLSEEEKPVTEEDLVEDSQFREVLNEDLEIEVAGTIYKVTPYGTMMANVEHYDKMKAIADKHNMDSQRMGNQIDMSLFSNPTGDEGYYALSPEVLLYDTHEIMKSEEQPVTDLTPQTVPMLSAIKPSEKMAAAPRGSMDFWEITNGIYTSLPVQRYGRHTVVGKIWSSIWGDSEVYSAKFNKKRRVKVKLYNKNYVLVKTVGASVQAQKKNWIGWSGVNADELRIGWDGISFTVVNNTIPANPWEAMHKAVAPYRNTGNPDWARLERPNPINMEFDLLGYDVRLDLSRGFQQGVYQLFNATKNHLGKNVPKNHNTTIVAWLNRYRNIPVVIAGPNEIRVYNQKSIDLTFYNSISVYFTFNSSSGWVKNAYNGLSGSRDLVKVNLQYASLYGVARYGNQWKGTVIEKSN